MIETVRVRLEGEAAEKMEELQKHLQEAFSLAKELSTVHRVEAVAGGFDPALAGLASLLGMADLYLRGCGCTLHNQMAGLVLGGNLAGAKCLLTQLPACPERCDRPSEPTVEH